MDIVERAIKLEEKQALFANLLGTNEAKDQYHRINCNGFGRVRSFSNFSMHLQSDVLPRRKFNRLGSINGIYSSQVFQVAVCDLHCWYCFVDKSNRSGASVTSRYMSPAELLDLCCEDGKYPDNIDISGGSPDLVPEFTIWMLEEIEKRGLKGKISVWVDSNLNGEYYEKCLSNSDLHYISQFPGFKFLCSLKGWNEESAYFNSGLRGVFRQQIECLEFFSKNGMNLYIYLTLLSSNFPSEEDLRKLFAQLYAINRDLPTYTIPLGIKPFHAVSENAKASLLNAWKMQIECANMWDSIMLEQYSADYILRKFQ